MSELDNFDFATAFTRRVPTSKEAEVPSSDNDEASNKSDGVEDEDCEDVFHCKICPTLRLRIQVRLQYSWKTSHAY